MSENIYQHYRSNELIFVDKVIEWLTIVDNQYTPYLTPFLSPRETMIIEQLASIYLDIKVKKFGGYSKAERKRTLIYPSYYEVSEEAFEIIVLSIKYPKKFAEMSHHKILGTLMSQGFDRNKIGDIITDGENWQVFIDMYIAEFMRMNIIKIGNVGVSLQAVDVSDIIEPNESWQEIDVVASSMRLDTILGKVYNFSRQRSKDYIAAGDVKVNFMQIDRSDIEIGEQDIISLRKFGRFWINQIEGMTKKDNYRLSIRVLDR